MSLVPGRLVVIGSLGMFLRLYLQMSPLLLLALSAVALIFSSSGATARETFAPVNRSEVSSGLRWGVAAVQGRRPYMEDMYQVAHFSGLTHFFSVFDGHGGKRAAAWAHAHLLPNLLRALGSKEEGKERHLVLSNGKTAPPPDLDRACVSAFLSTDREFLQQAMQRSIPDGSTAVCCMLQHGAVGSRRLLVANLGDSRAALIRADGSALALSDDHKPNRPDEQARVEATGGHVLYAGCWRVQGDLAVSRAFGDCHLKRFGVSAEPELTAFSVGATDRYIVLATDGLWDVVDEEQCAEVVLRAADPLHASRALCDLATARGSMDNITALVVDLEPAAVAGGMA